jgi:hypothetical protein
MTVVSSKEFVANHVKYYNLALNEDVFIKRGKDRFQLVYTNVDNIDIHEQPILEPDDDLRRAITMDELLEGVLEDIHEFYANKS